MPIRMENEAKDGRGRHGKVIQILDSGHGKSQNRRESMKRCMHANDASCLAVRPVYPPPPDETA